MLAEEFTLPAASLIPLASSRGWTVPALPVAVAATVKVVLLPESVTVQVTPVAVPALLISAAVKLAALIASENVIEKFIGNEFVDAAWPTAGPNELTEGAVLSLV